MRLGTGRAGYSKLPCPYCKKEIDGNRMAVHKRTCPLRIYKAPITELLYGEIKKAGRWSEV